MKESNKVQRHISENYTGGVVGWRLFILHHMAKLLGVQITVEGFPLGAYLINRPSDEKPHG